ncbi:hypothetical protein QBC37DRAFT_164682 [Rhypophila decipiens]|uniref:Protein kinase domain-containing protein n=1 Tax=Rhypophila decipiens TaxID=261697 RepID=A0AAN6YHY5_9PEZI|nr:hypothetical protein QBC37DRAFT_164682 [Rhypophila decipiens]
MATTYFSDVSTATTPVPNLQDDLEHTKRFTSILSVAHACGVNFLPATWVRQHPQPGRGGQSEVFQYLARPEVGLVFKVLKHFWEPGSGEESVSTAVSSLIREMSILSQPLVKASPYVLQLEGVSWYANEGYPALVYRKGYTLKEYLLARHNKQDPLSVQQKLELCAYICMGLSALHTSGVVHADLKPANIIMCRAKWPEEPGDGDETLPKISDLGASVMGADDDLHRLPRTLGWTAPEWHDRFFRMQNARRMDVFSFGLIVFWVLAWDSTFASVAVEAEEAEMRRLTDLDFVKGGLLMPHVQDMLRAIPLREEVHRNLTILFQKSLADDPQERASSADELLPLLVPQSHLLGSPSTQPLPTPSPQHSLCSFRLVDWIEKLSLADFRVREHLFEELKASTRSSCETCRRNSSFQAAICCELGFGTESGVKQRDAFLLAGSWTDEEYLDRLNEFVDLASRPLPASIQHFFEADLAHEYQRRKLTATACKHLQREMEARSEKLGNDHFLTIMVKSALAQVLDIAGKYLEAVQVQIELCGLHNNTLGHQHPVTIAAMSQLALFYHNAGHPGKALATAQSAYEWSKEALTEDHRETMASMANLALCLSANQRYTEAIELQELVTERYEASLGMIHPDTIKCYLNLAAYYSLHPTSQGRAAERMLIAYTKIRDSGLHDHHDYMWAVSNLVDYVEPGLLSSEEALEFRQRAYEEGKRLLGEDHPDTWIFAAKLACTLANLEKWDDAQGLFSEARSKLEELLGPSHRDVLKSTISFAEINRVRGKHVAAYDLLPNLVCSDAVETAADQELARDTIAVLTATGMLLESQGKDHEAKPIWERVVSITISRGLDSMAYEDYRMARRSLAEIYVQEGNEQKGKEILDELREWTARNLGKDSVEALVLEIDRANQMFESGAHVSALKLLQGIREKIEAIEPQTRRVCRGYYRSLMHAYRLCDKIEEAISLAEDYLRVLEPALGTSHEDTLKTKNSLAIYYMEAQRYDEAETIWLKLQEIYEQRTDEDQCLVIMSNLAWLYNDKGELPDAIRLIRNLLERRERFSGSRSLDYMDDLYHGAKILGQDPDCLEEAIQMATVYRDHFRSRPPGDQLGARGSWGLGRLLRRMGRNDEALECFHDVLERSREMVADDKDEWISDAEKEIRELENLAVAVDSTASE